MRDSFIFYKSFYNALQDLPDEDRLSVLDAMMAYQFDDTASPCVGIPKAIFTLIKPQLDANNRRYENGTKGGRPPKHNHEETKKEPRNNLTETKPKANENVNGNDNGNVNKKDTPKPPRGPVRYSGDFEYFWSIWKPYDMPKGDKQEAAKFFEKALKETDNETIIRTATQYCAECHRGQSKTKHAGRWLAKRGWANDPTHHAATPTDNRPGKTSFDTVINAAFETGPLDRMGGNNGW